MSLREGDREVPRVLVGEVEISEKVAVAADIRRPLDRRIIGEAGEVDRERRKVVVAGDKPGCAERADRIVGR